MNPMAGQRSALAAALVATVVLPAAPRAQQVSAPQQVAPAAAPAPAANGWWAVYHDPGLEALMARLHAANPTIAAAVARLDMQRAEARIDGAAGQPTLELGGAANRARGPLINATGESGDLYTVRSSASWELDLLGRLADERRAARAEVAAARASLADITLLTEVALARAWFVHTAAALAAREARQAELTLERLAAMAVQRRQAGLIAAAALDTAQQRLADGTARRRALEERRDRAAREVTSLVGLAPDAPLATPASLPEPPVAPADLPADLLARRPDLRLAQARVIAADARLSAARKGWLPPLALTAVRGQASAGLAGLLSAAGSVFGLGAALALPVFDGGRHRARVAYGRADRVRAEAEYREAVATALRDVHDRLQAAATARADWLDARARDRAGEVLLGQDQARAANGTMAASQALESLVSSHERHIAVHLAHGQSLAEAVALQSSLGGPWEQAGAAADQ